MNNSIPVQYEANYNPWITSTLFQKSLVLFDNEMKKINSILVIVYCAAHRMNVRLEDVVAHSFAS